MAVVQLVDPEARKRLTGKPELVTNDEPDPADATTETGEDGSVVITIGASREDDDKDDAGDTSFEANLALRLKDDDLATICEHLLQGIEADIESRREWLDTANTAANYLGIKLQEPSSTVAEDGTVCKAIASTMLEAMIKSWGTARSELLPAAGPVKVARMSNAVIGQPAAGIGHNGGPPLDEPPAGIAAAPPAPGAPPAPPIAAPDPDADRDALAQALEADMNWYLTKGDREYYPDYSRMLFSRALIGNAFRKVYRCPLRRKPISTWVKAQNLIVSNDCSHLSAAGRITEVIRMRQPTMARMRATGVYRQVELALPTGETTDTEKAVGEVEGIAAGTTLTTDHEYMIYETYAELGQSAGLMLNSDVLDKDETGKKPGYPLPYRITMDQGSREILEIRRNWEKGDADHTPVIRYVKYGFIPGLGFYDFGLIHILGNTTQVATMLLRSNTDAGLFANFPGGLILEGPGSRGGDTVFRPSPGQFCSVKNSVGATSIDQIVKPLPYKAPSEVSLAMQAKMEGDARRLAGVVDIPVGEGRIGNTPVGTIMSYIEAVTQVPGAVHKDDHIAQADEFDKLRRLLAREPEVLTRGNRSPARVWQTEEELMAPDLLSAADPNTPSQIHRLMKLQGLVSLGGLPQFGGIADNRAIYAKAARILTDEDPSHVMMPPAPPGAAQPDPKIVAAQIKAQADQARTQGDMQKAQLTHDERMQEIASENQQREADRESAERRAQLGLAGAKVKAAATSADKAADRTHELGLAAGDKAHEAHMATLAPPFAGPLGDAGGGGDQGPS